MKEDLLTIKAYVGGKTINKSLIWGKDWGEEKALFLDIERIQTFLMYNFHNRAWDFARIAAAVYAADRNIKRPPKSGNDAWVREIHLKFSVTEPDFWNSTDTAKLMTEVLHFLTGDDWYFEFIATVKNGQMRYLAFDFPESTKYFLYSGGLDSAAGLVKYAYEHPGEIIIPLLIGHRSNMAGKVKNQIQRIHEKFTNVQRAVVASFKMSSPKNEERSQRSRNFLFLAIAGIATTKHDNDSLVLLGENGIGAINLPLSTLMISTMATRGTHPTFLSKMSNLSSHVLGKRIEYSLPNLHLTKGELVKVLKAQGLEGIVTTTFSCSHLLREKITDQCGQCPACIFRRQSLWIAGIAEDERRYKHHLFEFNSSAISRIAKEAVCNYLEMIDRVRTSKTKEAVDWIAYHCKTTEMTATPEIYDLFGRYRREWLDLCDAAQKERWSWGSFKMPYRYES